MQENFFMIELRSKHFDEIIFHLKLLFSFAFIFFIETICCFYYTYFKASKTSSSIHSIRKKDGLIT